MDIKVDHEVDIRRVGNAAVATPSVIGMDIGETIRYSSPDGSVRIEFPQGSPYDQTIVRDGEVHVVQNQGHFSSRCFLILPDNSEIGWSLDSQQSGADHDVPRQR
jgi:hypothetical protein